MRPERPEFWVSAQGVLIRDGRSVRQVGLTHRTLRTQASIFADVHSLPEGIILWGTSAGVGEANDKLTPGNIAIVLMARRSWIKESSFRYGHCECRGGRALMDLKEFSFSF